MPPAIAAVLNNPPELLRLEVVPPALCASACVVFHGKSSVKVWISMADRSGSEP